MGQYMYKAHVPTEKSIIRKDEIVKIDDAFITLKEVLKLNLSNMDSFTIMEGDRGGHYIEVERVRYETNEEFQKRQKSKIDYNKRFDEYHSKK